MHRFLALLKVREAEARGKAMILQARNDAVPISVVVRSRCMG